MRWNSNPVLVGATTILVVTVAVFLSYNANRGLPFVPVHELEIELPNGAAVVNGNEVREGGDRIGVVKDLRPTPLSNGEVGAVARVALDDEHGRVPVDSRVVVRLRSPLGLKYLDLRRGRSERVFSDGDTIRVERTRLPVELDEVYSMSDRRTRHGVRGNLQGFGDALAGRGMSLNRTLEEAPRFLGHLRPVMRTLGARETRLPRFFREVGDFVRVLRPVADRYAHAFEAGADAFEAWSRHPDSVRATLRKSPPTLSTGIRSLRVQRPFLTDMAAFSRELHGAARLLPRTLPRVIPALQAGQPILRRSPELNARLRDTLGALRDLMEAPGTGRGLRALTGAVTSLNPTLRFLGPYITVCNYFNYAWTHVAEHLAEPDPTGGSQRTLLNQAGRQTNSVTSLGAAEPANGQGVMSGTPQHLHVNNYTAAIDRRGNADCESGQRGYVERAAHFWDPKWKLGIDPHIPGNQGPTYTGRPRVPKGQTFSREPELGPRLPRELDP